MLGRRSHSRRTSSTRLHVECAGHGTDRMKYRIIWPVLLTTRYRRADSPLVLRREDRLDIECAAAGKGELRLAVRKMSVQTPSALCFAVEPSGKHGRDRVPELRRPTTIYSRLIKPAAGMIGLPSESAPCPSAIASSGGFSISSVTSRLSRSEKLSIRVSSFCQSLPKRSVGERCVSLRAGYDYMERVYLSAFDHADTEAILDAIDQKPWPERRKLQVFC